MKLIDIINEDSTEKEKKRVRAIHKALRKGFVEVDGNRFRYELPEEYTFHMLDNQLKHTSIKFIFYNHDLGRDLGGLNLPLKVWRIENGNEEYVNEILSIDEVSDICYGDVYLLNSRSGVDYENVKNKVRNKYSTFNVNAIMTTVSDWKGINESHEDNIQKQIKKGKTIFKALKKGVIGGDNPEEPHFKYELSDDFTVNINNVGIVISLKNIKIKQLNRGCLLHSTDYMGSLIRKRFHRFGIYLTSKYEDRYFEYDVEPWESPINESNGEPSSDSLRRRKRAGIIYNVYKKGKVVQPTNSGVMEYSYELSDKKLINAFPDGDVVVTPYNIKIFKLNKLTNKNDLLPVMVSLRNKFDSHGIRFMEPYFNNITVINWKEPDELNEAVRYTEDDITDKDRKRAKLIYKTFKVGIFPSDNDNDIKYRYTLPDEYYISIDDESGDIIIALTINPEKQLKVTALFDTGTPTEREMDVDLGYDHVYRNIKRKIKEKFESFNIQIVF